MKALKKIAKVAMSIIAAIAFFAMMAEANDPGMQFVLVLASAITLALCNAGLQAIGAYEENNK